MCCFDELDRPFRLMIGFIDNRFEAFESSGLQSAADRLIGPVVSTPEDDKSQRFNCSEWKPGRVVPDSVADTETSLVSVEIDRCWIEVH